MAQSDTLGSLVTRYRRAVTDASLAKADIELEVRFQNVDLHVFQTVLSALAEKHTGSVSNTVNAIMGEADAASVPGRHGLQTNQIRQITFDTLGTGKKLGERYYRKWPIVSPVRVNNPHALNYTVVLSAEETMLDRFVNDSGAVIRVKSRASFTLGGWRADLTVTRSIQGTDAQSALPGIIGTMFRAGPMTPGTMLDVLKISDPDSEARAMYSYEIEAEYTPEASADDIRPADVSAIADSVLRLANPEYIEDAVFQAEVFHIAGFIVKASGYLRRYEHEFGLKRLLSKVTALTRGKYKSMYPPTGCFLLDKADGIRAVASVRDGKLLLLADKLTTYENATPKGESLGASSTIVDGELVTGADGSAVFYAFDVIAVMGENVSDDGYENRIERLAEAIDILKEFGLAAEAKPIIHLTGSEPDELEAQFKSPQLANRPYEIDGRIIVKPGKSYLETKTFKWKAEWDTTIDFLVRRAPASILGQKPFIDAPGCELHFLFVGIRPDMFAALGLERVPGYNELFGTGYNSGSYFPIQFSPSDAPLAYMYQHPTKKPKGEKGWEGWAPRIDGQVIEMRCAGQCKAAGALGLPNWQIVRLREDRAREIRTQMYFGNDFKPAEQTWLNYLDPFAEEQLWSGVDLGYFAAAKTTIYRAQTAFTSFVKGRRIEKDLSHADWVIDAAIGKGQDLGRYVRAGVRRLVGIDIDRNALTELVQRKFTHAKGGPAQRRGHRRHPTAPTSLFVLQADLTTPHEGIAAQVRSISGFPDGANGMVCNLAVHYFAGDIANIRNFAALCRDLVRVGGVVTMTTMSGQKVHSLLSTQKVGVNESWDSRHNGAVKYSIRRGYSEDTLTEAGQRVGVLLPFSDGEYYDEYLVNVDVMVAEFEKRGFVLVEKPNFASYFNDFQTHNPSEYKTLTAGDFIYLSLYTEIVLRREE